MPLLVTALGLSLLGSCGGLLVASSLLRKGKVSFADMANAALAGGVSVGATCNVISPMGAFAVGLAAGSLCVAGYTLIQPRLDKSLRIVDTCGVHNLHGMPGLLGGLTAALVVPGVAKAQLLGIAFTVVLAFAAGTLSGYLVAAAGRKAAAYADDEFLAAAEDGDSQGSGAVGVALSLQA